MRLQKFHKEAIVHAIVHDLPPIDTEARAEAIKAAIAKAMSPEVRKMFKTNPKALRESSVKFADPFRYWGGNTIVGDVTDEKLKEITQPYEQQANDRDAMSRKLTAAFAGITTLKQALETFPEFKKYYPTEAEPTKNLPALANVMADLSKLGWPKK